MIRTHIKPSAARRGVGRALFAATIEVARAANLPAIEVFIGAQNAEELAYYEAIGFHTYREVDGAVPKVFYL